MPYDPSPWSAETTRLPIQSAYLLTYGLTLETPSGALISLRPVKASISYDGRRTPYVTATADIAWPAPATLSLLDPVAFDIRLRVRAGYIRMTTGLKEVYEIARLRVQTVTKDYLAQTVTITAASDEAVVISQCRSSEITLGAASTITAGIQQLIADALPGEVPTWVVTADTAATFGVSTKALITDDIWDTVTDWADVIRAKVLHDGAGVWRLFVPPSTPSGASAALLRTGPRGSITAASITDDRASALTDVIVKYTYAQAGTAWLGYGFATTGERPRAMRAVTREKKPLQDPGMAAFNLLRRGIRRGHTMEIEAAPHYWIRPYDTVSIALPGRKSDRLLVESVTFTLDTGTMALTGSAPVGGKENRISFSGGTSVAAP